MISPAYVRLMARYNGWQNAQVAGFIAPMDKAALTLDRGAFCKSILGTLNHILWADSMWMSRFSDSIPAPRPVSSMQQTTALTTDAAAWQAGRQAMDQSIAEWAEDLDQATLEGDLEWYSAVSKSTLRKPMAACVVHFFNHQTHHRGQVHAMITTTGSEAPVSDLVFMPEDA